MDFFWKEELFLLFQKDFFGLPNAKASLLEPAARLLFFRTDLSKTNKAAVCFMCLFSFFLFWYRLGWRMSRVCVSIICFIGIFSFFFVSFRFVEVNSLVS